MQFEWDKKKARSNQTKHGIEFELGLMFEFDNALVSIDNDPDHEEERLKAIGIIRGNVYVLVYTETNDVVRIISLRKANRRETNDYVKSQ